MITLKCQSCGKEFERFPSDIKRGWGKYCSRSCRSGKDEFSPFRWFYQRITKSAERTGIPVEIDLQDLKTQWDQQKGICPFTGWEMENLPTSDWRNSIRLSPRRASLDRIDSTQGYTKENIQWVCRIANYAKNGWDDQTLIDFCSAVAKHHG